MLRINCPKLHLSAVLLLIIWPLSVLCEPLYRVPGIDDKITRATPLTRKVRQSNEATHLLSVQFNLELINGLIAEQVEQIEQNDESDAEAEPEIPASALVWMLVDDGNGQHRIGGPTGKNVMDRAREIAGGFGLGLHFPEQDSQDLVALSTTDLETGSTQAILTASSRYQEPMIMSAALTRLPDGTWSAVWFRHWGDTIDDHSSSSASLDQALQTGLRWLATVSERIDEEPMPSSETSFNTDLGSGFGQSENSNTASLWINRLQSTEGYASVMQLIENVESVDYAYPIEMLPAGVLIAVSPRFALADVMQELSTVSWLRSSQALDPNARSAQLSNVDGYFEYLR